MLALDDNPQDSASTATLASQPQVDAPAQSAALGTPGVRDPPPTATVQLPLHAAPYLGRLRGALRRYVEHDSPAALQDGFAAASAIIATLVDLPGAGRPDTEQLHALARGLPELGDLLSCAADEAERAIGAGIADLWLELGLRVPASCWTAGEWEAARTVFACACAPGAPRDVERLRASLRALAAGRSAQALCAALAAGEQPWMCVLRERYESVRHRCARRTLWRSRGLSDLIRDDEACRTAVTERLERWVSAGGAAGALSGELEAALVHARTPPRFA